MATRPATKAGSWYLADPEELNAQLERNLNGVNIDGKTLPIPGARIIIAPHAGYEYSGECAAWAYKCLDLSGVTRVFILGPSHVAYIKTWVVSGYAHYDTPFGPLEVDVETAEKLCTENGIQPMNSRDDAKEHSLELHLPYLYKRMAETFNNDPQSFPKIVPIVVGNLKGDGEKAMGAILEPYVADPQNAFIVSSDFCHWGSAFDYPVYSPTGKVDNLQSLGHRQAVPAGGCSVEDTIEAIDMHALNAVKSGKHDEFLASLQLTQNTVCGRHPIGVMMAALEVRAENEGQEKAEGRFRFIDTKYTTSGRVKDDAPIRDYKGHSVSYVSAYALA